MVVVGCERIVASAASRSTVAPCVVLDEGLGARRIWPPNWNPRLAIVVRLGGRSRPPFRARGGRVRRPHGAGGPGRGRLVDCVVWRGERVVVLARARARAGSAPDGSAAASNGRSAAWLTPASVNRSLSLVTTGTRQALMVEHRWACTSAWTSTPRSYEMLKHLRRYVVLGTSDAKSVSPSYKRRGGAPAHEVAPRIGKPARRSRSIRTRGATARIRFEAESSRSFPPHRAAPTTIGTKSRTGTEDQRTNSSRTPYSITSGETSWNRSANSALRRPISRSSRTSPESRCTAVTSAVTPSPGPQHRIGCDRIPRGRRPAGSCPRQTSRRGTSTGHRTQAEAASGRSIGAEPMRPMRSARK